MPTFPHAIAAPATKSRLSNQIDRGVSSLDVYRV
jgi:hypothetical protein